MIMTAGTAPPAAEVPENRLSPATDPSLAKDIHMHFYGTGLQRGGGAGAMPTDQALIPTAPPEDSEPGVDVPGAPGEGALGVDPSAAPDMHMIYPAAEDSVFSSKGVPGAPPLPPASHPAPLPPQPAPAPVSFTLPVAAMAAPVSYGLPYGEAPIAVAEVYVEESKT
jgi:hypothetical protein